VRPLTVSSVEGLYFAGDYTRQATDVTSMEGAVRSGLMAAEAIRDRYAHGTARHSTFFRAAVATAIARVHRTGEDRSGSGAATVSRLVPRAAR